MASVARRRARRRKPNTFRSRPTVASRCIPCDGTGQSLFGECLDCHGTGFGPDAFAEWWRCPVCGGENDDLRAFRERGVFFDWSRVTEPMPCWHCRTGLLVPRQMSREQVLA